MYGQLPRRPATVAVNAAVRFPQRDGGLRQPRVEAIDMARGAAMLFVCLAHFSGAYLAPRGAEVSGPLAMVGMIASPTFMMISGVTTGFLGVLYPRSLPRLQRRLLDRGVFTLLVGHFVLALSIAVRSGSLSTAYRLSFITDPIAIAIMIGPRLVGRVRSARIALSLCLYMMGWSLVFLWQPTSSVGSLLKPYLVGTMVPDSASPFALTFPLLQWLAVYLLGMVLGEHVGRVFPGDAVNARQPFLRAALISIAAGLALNLSVKALRLAPSTLIGVFTAHLASPTQKFPPGPAYLLFFGGWGLLIIWLVLRLEERRGVPMLLQFLQRLGQASLVVYLLQAFVYSSVIRRVTAPYTQWWPVLFLASLAPLGVLATLWCRSDGNRLLSVGITSVLETRAKGSRNSIASNAPHATGTTPACRS